MTWQPGESGNPGGRPKEYGRVRDLAREEIRVALDEFETKDASYDMVSMRVFYEDGGEYRPGRNGLNVRVELLPAIVAALRDAETEARAAGLLDGEDEMRAA